MSPSPRTKRAAPPPGRVTLAAQIRETVAARRLSTTALAAASGVDRTQLAVFLKGGKTVTLDTADLLAAALGLRFTESAPRKPSRPPAPAGDGRSVFEVLRDARELTPVETEAEQAPE